MFCGVNKRPTWSIKAVLLWLMWFTAQGANLSGGGTSPGREAWVVICLLRPKQAEVVHSNLSSVNATLRVNFNTVKVNIWSCPVQSKSYTDLRVTFSESILL